MVCVGKKWVRSVDAPKRQTCAQNRKDALSELSEQDWPSWVGNSWTILEPLISGVGVLAGAGGGRGGLSDFKVLAALRLCHPHRCCQ